MGWVMLFTEIQQINLEFQRISTQENTNHNSQTAVGAAVPDPLIY